MYLYIGANDGWMNQNHKIHLVMEDEDGAFIENRSGTLSMTLTPLMLAKQLAFSPPSMEISANLKLDYNPEDNADTTQQAIPNDITIVLDGGCTHIDIMKDEKRYASLWKDTELTDAAKLAAAVVAGD
jgi:hypothetical protein